MRDIKNIARERISNENLYGTIVISVVGVVLVLNTNTNTRKEKVNIHFFMH